LNCAPRQPTQFSKPIQFKEFTLNPIHTAVKSIPSMVRPTVDIEFTQFSR